jgi:hypothetical protein
VTVNNQGIEQFRSAFRGAIVRSEDPDYEATRRIWNASVTTRPDMIAQCTGLADVIAAVKVARANGLLVAIRGGGHNVGGRALCEGGLVIDLSRMKGIHVDAAARRVRVQPGVTLGELDRETHVYGLAVPAGVVSKTGIAGLTLGGGVGWLCRKYGMTVDNVISFELVTAEGNVLHVSEDEHADLFWALRGGGGNFGVVTSFEYGLHPVGTVLGGLILHPRERASDLLKFYRSFTTGAPDELAAYAALLYTPDGMPAAAIATCYCGDAAEGERVMKPLRAFGTPLLDAIQPIPFPQMQQLLDAAVPDGNQNYWKSTFLRELSDAAIDEIVTHANQATSPLTAVLVEQYGGAMSRVADDATAFAHRKAGYDLAILGQWVEAGESERHIGWVRGFAEAMTPYRSGAYLLNFLGEEGDDTIRAAFGGNYDRLVEIKRKYDPDNFFRRNQNIQPTKAASAASEPRLT